MTSSKRSESGLTLIELVMSLVLLSILAFTSLELIGDSVEDSRYSQTQAKLEQIKVALIGDPNVRENGVRTSFGYVGDVGELPDSTQGLQALLTRPSAAPTPEVYPFRMDANARMGSGWNGPYLTTSGSSTNALKDAWGNDLVYTPPTSPSPAIIKSHGADGRDDSEGGGTGYNKDIVIEIPEEAWRGTVYGYINNRGSPYPGESRVVFYRPTPNPSPAFTVEEVTLPDRATSTPAAGDPVGQFSFTAVPFGKRSVVVYVPMVSPTPTKTIGPVIFTLDRKNFELNEDAFDVSQH